MPNNMRQDITDESTPDLKRHNAGGPEITSPPKTSVFKFPCERTRFIFSRKAMKTRFEPGVTDRQVWDAMTIKPNKT